MDHDWLSASDWGGRGAVESRGVCCAVREEGVVLQPVGEEEVDVAEGEAVGGVGGVVCLLAEVSVSERLT